MVEGRREICSDESRAIEPVLHHELELRSSRPKVWVSKELQSQWWHGEWEEFAIGGAEAKQCLLRGVGEIVEAGAILGTRARSGDLIDAINQEIHCGVNGNSRRSTMWSPMEVGGLDLLLKTLEL